MIDHLVDFGNPHVTWILSGGHDVFKFGSAASAEGLSIYIYGSVSDKGVTLQYPGAKYHVSNLSTICVFILSLSFVSICSMCYVRFFSLPYV